MKYQLLSDATYDRWSKWGTLYGVTRYSFVALTDRSDFATGVIRTHVHTMYFQMMLLTLATRASILRFSDEVSAVATLKDTREEDRLKVLYEKYLSFYNRLYFKEVTHQDQGIEIYDMALKQLKIPEHIAKLDGKFVKLFDLANLKGDNRTAKAMNTLTMIGTALLLPSLAISFFGMDALKEYEWVKNYGAIISFALIPVGYFLANYIVKKDENNE